MNRSITFLLSGDCLLLRFWTIVSAFCMCVLFDHWMRNAYTIQTVWYMVHEAAERLFRLSSLNIWTCTVCAKINWTRAHEPKHTATILLLCAPCILSRQIYNAHLATVINVRTNEWDKVVFVIILCTYDFHTKENTLCALRAGKTEYDVCNLSVCLVLFISDSTFSEAKLLLSFWWVSEYFVVSLCSKSFILWGQYSVHKFVDLSRFIHNIIQMIIYHI